jgi:Fic family protein
MDISFVGFGAKFDPVPAEVARRLLEIGRAAGRADLYRGQFPRLLDALRERARVESVTASSAIEGVVAPPARARAMVEDVEAAPRSRSEAELRGYSNALTYIFTGAATESELSLGLILHLHRLLFEPAGLAGAGQFKTADNLVVDRLPDGSRETRFTPVAAARTPETVSDLVAAYNDARRRPEQTDLVVIAAAVLDFTIIHPFADGNGRVSRLLLNLLLTQAGYDVGRYVSLERLIERSKERYYDSLLRSTRGWETGAQDVWPSIGYLVEIVEQAYSRFIRFAEVERASWSKRERVRAFLDGRGRQPFSIAEIRRAIPGVSEATIRIVLHELRDEGRIVGASGRAAQWQWVDRVDADATGLQAQTRTD